MTVTHNFLRRYTNLPAVIRILKTSTITFLPPRHLGVSVRANPPIQGASVRAEL